MAHSEPAPLAPNPALEMDRELTRLLSLFSHVSPEFVTEGKQDNEAKKLEKPKTGFLDSIENRFVDC